MIVDLRSDTVTKPTPAMYRAMVDAPLGDDVFAEDPTVNRLEAVAAERAGTESALFVPSGTMANQLAIRCWTRPGDEVLMEAGAHPYNYEAAGAAAISGVQVRAIPGDDGILDPDVVAGFIRPDNDHFSPATLLCVENTANRGGGSIYPLERLATLRDLAHDRGLKIHLDGARAWNAAVEQGVGLDRIARGYDSLMFCLSKGLGAPAGSMLCGPKGFIHTARRMRKMLGGGMRQSGILAGAGLYALEHNVERLAEDHVRARRLYDGLSAAGFDAQAPQTNMVYVAMADAGPFAAQLQEAGVRCIAVAPTRIRLVVHLDVDDAGIEKTIAEFARLGAR